LENKKDLKEQLEDLQPGALIYVEWSDASVGKSLNTGVGVDLPVKSWGVFIGILGRRRKHIVLAQNAFEYTDGLYDIDFTAIPLTWTNNIKIVDKDHITMQEAQILMRSFIQGGRAGFKNKKQHKQQKVRNHGNY